jgi:hypothetical protein
VLRCLTDKQQDIKSDACRKEVGRWRAGQADAAGRAAFQESLSRPSAARRARASSPLDAPHPACALVRPPTPRPPLPAPARPPPPVGCSSTPHRCSTLSAWRWRTSTMTSSWPPPAAATSRASARTSSLVRPPAARRPPPAASLPSSATCTHAAGAVHCSAVTKAAAPRARLTPPTHARAPLLPRPPRRARAPRRQRRRARVPARQAGLPERRVPPRGAHFRADRGGEH